MPTRFNTIIILIAALALIISVTFYFNSISDNNYSLMAEATKNGCNVVITPQGMVTVTCFNPKEKTYEQTIHP